MEIFIAIVSGLIQGLTEFIPVSSSGHLVLLHEFVPALSVDDLVFDVALHVGTLLALLIFFWKDATRLLSSWWEHLGDRAGRLNDPDSRLAWLIILATLPAVVVGYFFEQVIDLYFRHIFVVVGMLVLVGILFLLLDKPDDSRDQDIARLSPRRAFWIGVAQALALIPGTSRSGITIITGRYFGLKRADAARFSFLLSMPIVAGAGLKKALDGAILGLSANGWLVLGLGVLTSAVVGFLAIAFLMRFLQKHSLRVFAYYRFALAIFIFILLLT